MDGFQDCGVNCVVDVDALVEVVRLVVCVVVCVVVCLLVFVVNSLFVGVDGGVIIGCCGVDKMK